MKNENLNLAGFLIILYQTLRIEQEMSANVQPILHSSFFIFKELFPSYKFLF